MKASHQCTVDPVWISTKFPTKLAAKSWPSLPSKPVPSPSSLEYSRLPLSPLPFCCAPEIQDPTIQEVQYISWSQVRLSASSPELRAYLVWSWHTPCLTSKEPIGISLPILPWRVPSWVQFQHLTPNIVPSDQINSPVLVKMSGDWVIMIVLQNSELKVAHIRHVDAVVTMEQPFWVHRSAKDRVVKMGRDGWVGMESRIDIRVEGLDDHNDWGQEYRGIEGCGAERGS